MGEGATVVKDGGGRRKRGGKLFHRSCMPVKRWDKGCNLFLICIRFTREIYRPNPTLLLSPVNRSSLNIIAES